MVDFSMKVSGEQQGLEAAIDLMAHPNLLILMVNDSSHSVASTASVFMTPTYSKADT